MQEQRGKGNGSSKACGKGTELKIGVHGMGSKWVLVLILSGYNFG